MDQIEEKLTGLDTHLTEMSVQLAEIRTKLEADGILNLMRQEYLEKAVVKAESEMNRRLEGMNEFRTQLEMQAKTFLSYDMYSANHKTIEVKIEAMQKIVWGGLAIVSFLVFAIPLVMHFLNS